MSDSNDNNLQEKWYVGKFEELLRDETYQVAGKTIELGDDGQITLKNVPSATQTKQQTYYVDGTDALANRGLTINFVHVPTQKYVTFKAFLTAFNETYSSDWSSEAVYGRADPIHMFKQTTRSISMGWKIVAGSEGEAFENLGRLQQFLQMLYPTYKEANKAQTINQSPLIRMQLSNMVRKANAMGGYTEGLKKTASPANKESGLLGIIKNVSISHNLESPDAGAFEMGTPSQGTDEAGNPNPATLTNNILPKVIEIQMDFSVIHEQMLGWAKTGTGNSSTWTFGGSITEPWNRNFPYYVNVPSDEKYIPTAADIAAQQATWSNAMSDLRKEVVSTAAQQNAIAEYNRTLSELSAQGDTTMADEVRVLQATGEKANQVIYEMLGQNRYIPDDTDGD